uniref:Uncharacterized protein n=1 Tax=Pseudictyota dubia TaxID=2749911 RepID=A0A7R9ZGP8_9STRA|mmetsp:Transcript_4933/g.8534  ORF Transcript_4933/g.8534 Transcript_4933/m.8534 type:complete len:201 (+) Transcript_4933:137-739(+)
MSKQRQRLFQPKLGYATAACRKQWIESHDLNYDDPKVSSDMVSLEASLNVSEPLYFWQLYSLIGHQPVLDIVQNFYERVFDDHEAPWFRDVFVRIGGIEYHVSAQAAYWVDAMGGGKLYHGGNVRVQFHHQHNARKVMTLAGAERWMHHMRGALDEYDFSRFNDPRIKLCILEFLRSRMKVYADQHGWKFDEKAFTDSAN